ncbi:MAG: Eco57I restriction-modification methylase [Candidatus Argoarchaeum ethanivorans]|uniref:site-specific DNA-methyltransferase (adenine-specific) n=1 Tax=Candidatus Argoarchaeum ethanivorans TaxID=2608793 RepID=A0A811T375_9EURY|nr:MAG: Eco57I restriction-modification methylase [Candidatus Argoarchaeum ethanivorans]
MTALVQLFADAINNRNLFSNHYLENQINSTVEWEKDEHVSAFKEIKKIYDTEIAFVEYLNESQLEKRFFRRVFQIILPNFEVQETTKTKDFPDYAFFPDEESLNNAHRTKGTKSFYNGSLAIGEVKKWNAELDRFGKNRHDKRRNPSFQIWLYLHETEPVWGILSNGHKWRLYYRDKPLDVYYEIDLAAIIEKKDLNSFKYFYYFFRKEAFLPNEEGRVFLENVLKGSAEYAREIGDNLKENVYRAMKKISEGFFHWHENNLDYHDPVIRELGQKNTMILLYRLLFLLYAEGKGLLDLKNEVYCESHSFYRIKKEVAERRDGSERHYYLPTSTTLWSSLKNLFRLIDKGSKSLGIDDIIHVPAYNGGLFDPGKTPFLETWDIGDRFLADATDFLSRSSVPDNSHQVAQSRRSHRNGDDLGFVDYSTLEIRHLGSIYEGLLEYRLKVAEEDLVVTGGKARKWVSLEEFNVAKKKKKSFDEFKEFDKIRRDELYLATDKGERKATGSYYTPDYIVNYIVENTISPVVAEKWREAKESHSRFTDATLSVKVLDPAMGSGHFLVGAVEFLARKLMEAAQKDIEAGLVEDDGHFTNDWARREAVSHCIYGVDLNELAVELAKVSLWLTSISKDKPLSFLDHRLKQGNSLIGANLEDLPWHPSKRGVKNQRRLDIPEGFIKKLVDTMSSIESLDDDSLVNVKKKEEIFEKCRTTREYDMIKTLADVRTSIYFGNEIDEGRYGKYSGDAFWSSESEWTERREKWFAQKGREIAENKKFFHWELEFPEIFFKGGALKENPGWDCVIGNPPYVRMTTMEKPDFDYLETNYISATGHYDIYVMFIEKSSSLINNCGYLGFITPHKFFQGEYGRGIRKYLTKTCQIKQIVDFGDRQIFESATSYTCLLFIMKKMLDEVEYIKLGSDRDPKICLHVLNKESICKIPFNSLSDKPWNFHIGGIQNLLDKMDNISIKLNDVSEKIFQGTATTADPIYIVPLIKESEKDLSIVYSKHLRKLIELEHKILRPMLKGQDIKRFDIVETNTHFIFPYDLIHNKAIGITPDNMERFYPKTLAYLTESKEKLDGRENGKMKERSDWYLYSQEHNLADFENPKILTQVLSNHSSFTFDKEGKYYFVGGGNAGGYGIRLKDNNISNYYFILSLLNSRVLEFYLKQISTTFRGGYFSFARRFIKHLPIRRINFTTLPEERTALADSLKSRYNANEFDKIIQLVEECLPKDAEGNFLTDEEKSDVVHDLLAYLAERMIEMNKEKNKEMKGFLEWFEGDRREDRDSD